MPQVLEIESCPTLIPLVWITKWSITRFDEFLQVEFYSCWYKEMWEVEEWGTLKHTKTHITPNISSQLYCKNTI